MSSFSIEVGSRLDALDLQEQLVRFSPWLLELRRDEWHVQGSLRGHPVSELEREVAVWMEQHELPPATVIVADGSPPDAAG